MNPILANVRKVAPCLEFILIYFPPQQELTTLTVLPTQAQWFLKGLVVRTLNKFYAIEKHETRNRVKLLLSVFSCNRFYRKPPVFPESKVYKWINESLKTHLSKFMAWRKQFVLQSWRFACTRALRNQRIIIGLKWSRFRARWISYRLKANLLNTPKKLSFYVWALWRKSS